MKEKYKKFYRDFLIDSILGGICISISGIVFLNVSGVIGSVLFAFGLLAIIHYRWCLYTGGAGFIFDFKQFMWLLFVLFGNIVGCFLVGSSVKYTEPFLVEKVTNIINNRLMLEPLQCILLSIGCGFIMTTAVKFARENKFLPLLFGVPVFIQSGFIHSIADAFYISVLPFDYINEHFNDLIVYYGLIVLGNFIGCNLVRILKFDRTA